MIQGYDNNLPLHSILLVDDDMITNFLNERIIKKMGFMGEIIVRTNGKDALNYLEKCIRTQTNLPSLILLDINMPVVSGIEFLKSFQKLNLNKDIYIPVTLLTSSVNDRDKKEIAELGYFEYINKPLSETRFQYIIERNFVHCMCSSSNYTSLPS